MQQIRPVDRPPADPRGRVDGSAEHDAEVLGLSSGLLLLLPAFALNRHLAEIKDIQEILDRRTAGPLSDGIAKKIGPTLQSLRVPVWSRRDQRLLVAGLVTLLASSAIKLLIAIAAMHAQPAGPAARAVDASEDRTAAERTKRPGDLDSR